MKKVVLSLAVVAAMFVSCKEAAENTEAAADSTVVEAPAVDYVNAVTADSTAVDSAAAPAAEAAAPAAEAAPAK